MPFLCFKKSDTDFDVSKKVPDKDRFYVITAVFNPVGFQSRYDLYHKFAEHMKSTGAQLITIECIFPTLNQHEFQVTNTNNPWHIQVTSDSIYWMKENLINIAVSRLPPHAEWVCWLDGDIQFDSKNWVQLTIKELKKYTVVQMFKKAKFLGPKNEVLRTDYSFGYSVVHNKPIDQNRYDEWYPHPGYGWAMSVKDFREINGLPDYDIVGSGDLHFAFSLLNRVSNALEDKLNLGFKQMILNHSDETYNILQNLSKSYLKEMVGFVPVNISHNWHGSRKDRQYVNRWKILIAHDFNYWTDVKKNSDGLLQLNPNKPGLQKDILDHFKMRNEDTSKIDEADDKNGKKGPVKSQKHNKADKELKKKSKKVSRKRNSNDAVIFGDFPDDDNGHNSDGGGSNHNSISGGSNSCGSGHNSDGGDHNSCGDHNNEGGNHDGHGQDGYYDNSGFSYTENYNGTVETTTQY